MTVKPEEIWDLSIIVILEVEDMLFHYPVPKFVLVHSVPQHLLWRVKRASVRAKFVTKNLEQIGTGVN